METRPKYQNRCPFYGRRRRPNQGFAAELVGLAPDIILTHTTVATDEVRRLTRAIPIVFVVVSDPVGSGFVASLPRPGGNITGFINIEASLVEKSVEALKEIAPGVTRAAIMFNPITAPYAEYYLRPFEAAARSLGVESVTAPVRNDADIEHVVADLARESNAGLVLMTDIFTLLHREAINRIAARYRVPVINSSRAITADGGLMTYGVDTLDLFRRAPLYIDRILKGANPGDLPVQVPTKFDVVINMKTARRSDLSCHRHYCCAPTN